MHGSPSRARRGARRARTDPRSDGRHQDLRSSSWPGRSPPIRVYEVVPAPRPHPSASGIHASELRRCSSGVRSRRCCEIGEPQVVICRRCH
jgi:hypothetical protein